MIRIGQSHVGLHLRGVPKKGKVGREEGHTACPPGAHGPVTRILRITTDIPHPRIVQSFPFELLAEHVLDAPETARCYGRFLGAGGAGDG